MAFRRSVALLGSANARVYSSEARDAFNSAFAKVAPMLDLPEFGSQNLNRPEPATGALPEKLTLNFFKPYGIEFKATEVRASEVPVSTRSLLSPSAPDRGPTLSFAS